MAAILLDYGFK